MNVILKNVLCLRAKAEDLKFLDHIERRISRTLGSRFMSQEFSNDESAHNARIMLEKKKDGFVLVFAHGGSNYIKGGEYLDRSSGEVEEAKDFMTTDITNLFRDKVVFCLSCDSNGLARSSIDAGAVAYVGFGAIPFRRFDDLGNETTNREFRVHAQSLIANALMYTLNRFFLGNNSLCDSLDYLRLHVSHDCVGFVRKMKSFKQRREIAGMMLKFKEDMQYWGNPNVYFQSDK